MGPSERFPANARLAYKGKIFEVWEWDQQMFDGSTQTFEGLKRPDTVQVLATVGDKILIEDQEQPGMRVFISPPGGRIDEGEEPLAAAQRELLEETGYISDDWELWKQYRPNGKIEWTIYTYIARDCELKQEPHLDAGERITVRPVSFEEFLMLSDDSSYRGQELVMEMLHARCNEVLKKSFRKRLFGEHA